MPEPDFRAALARVERAFTHREEMWSLAAENLKRHPVSQRFDEQPDEVRVMVKTTAEFPVEISVVFSEWLHCLRSALDATLYELAVADTGQDPPPDAGGRYFPIVTELEKLEGRALKGLSERTCQGIERMQPYHHTGGRTGSGLWWLHELARLDRHRRHHLFAWRFVELDVQANPSVFTGAGARVCEETAATLRDDDELELAAFRRRANPRPKGDHAIDVSYRIEPDIPDWIDNVYPSYRWRIDERMSNIELVVGQSIEMFRDGQF